MFETLTIRTDYTSPSDNFLIESVAQATNNHCSKIPQKLNIDMDRENVQFKFAHATNVELRTPERHTAAELDRIFPRMEKLKIHIITSYTLDQNFAHLRYFEVAEKEHRLFDLGPFAKHNRQLRGIYTPLNFEQLQQLSEMFPKLESLHIRLLDEISTDSTTSESSPDLGKTANDIDGFRNFVKTSVIYKKLQHMHTISPRLESLYTRLSSVSSTVSLGTNFSSFFGIPAKSIGHFRNVKKV